jgi:hypothetical protein
MHTLISWPRKAREMHSHHFDSTVWNDFEFRDDDIVIAAFGKAGTDVVPCFRRRLERDGYPFWSVWENVRSW